MSEPTKFEQLTVAVLAGGFGMRLREVVPDRQKVVAEVGGRPFLFYVLDQVAGAGLRDVVLCTGYKSQQVMDVVGLSYKELRIRYSVEAEPLGTAGALRYALACVRSDPVLVMNGDSYCEVDLRRFYQAHLGWRAAGSLVVREADDTSQGGRVRFDERGEVREFAEKTGGGSGWISAGIYLLSRRLLESIPAGCAVSIERETFPSWVGRGLYAFPTSGKFLDIGNPAGYRSGQMFFR